MIILDTNVMSELTRPRPNMRVIEWINEQPGFDLYTSAVSTAELLYGVEVMPAGHRRDRLLAETHAILEEEFGGRILPFDSYAARSYADIAAARRSAGRPINLADGQIAAIAHSLGAAVATRNTRDFEGCGIDVIDPWSGETFPERIA